MSSELNLAELPVDVLLNIFGKTDQEKTKQKSIRTTLRLVCRRFNSIIIDPSNQRRLSAIRMKIEMISIAQEELTNCRKKISCEGNAEFFEIISQFEPRRLELDRIDLTRSLIFSLIDCLRGYPRIQCINLKVLDLGERAKVLNTSFAKDIDAGTMAKFASNFHSLIHIPKEFVNSEFMEKWTNGSDTGGFDFVKPVEEYEQHTRIPLRNFNRFWIFESTKLFTTLAELTDAIEGRIKVGELLWRISLADDECEIRRFMQKNDLNYRAVERFHEGDTREAFRLLKVHKFNGIDYAVIILICRLAREQCYHAVCLNDIDVFTAKLFPTFLH